MTRRANRLLIIALAVVALTMGFGCSQSDDILTDVSETVLTLRSQLLPTLPAGMAYQLWLVDGDDTVSIGRFNYDQYTMEYLNEDGSVRADGGVFDFDGDVLAYDEIFISVENSPDPEPASPAAIMLWDRVTNPSDNPLKLVFPLSDSLWFSTCRFNMETTSDGIFDSLDGHGIWFSSYALQRDSVFDTTGISNIVIPEDSVPSIGNKPCTTTISGFNWTPIDTFIVLGFDTLPHQSVLIEWLEFTDCDSPFTIYGTIEYDVDTVLDTVIQYDNFTQDDFGLINYSDWGWHYKGWVVAPIIEQENASLGSFTPPAWEYDRLIPGADGGLLTTGTFSEIYEADDGNPYSLGTRVPPFPGEDFLTGLPNGADSINLVPGNGAVGSVFITLEPANYTDTTSNFPLILLSVPLPATRDTILANQTGDVSQITMNLYLQTNDPTLGFPKVDISLERR